MLHFPKSGRHASGVLLIAVSTLLAGCMHTKEHISPTSNARILLPGGVILDMVRIPAGEFMMGACPDELDAYTDEKPQHRVRISRDFWMGKFEVTMAQWQSVMGTAPWRDRPCVEEAPINPAVFVSWDAAQEFAARLAAITGNACRLPTEAEWEYAARAGNTGRFHWGDDAYFEEIDIHAWWRRTALNTDHRHARPVGQKTPNAWGLFDTVGNVFEWCEDWYGAYDSASGLDPHGPSTGSRRTNRGGSWITVGGSCRLARRGQDAPSAAYDDLGFRIVMTDLPQGTEK